MWTSLGSIALAVLIETLNANLTPDNYAPVSNLLSSTTIATICTIVSFYKLCAALALGW